MPKITAASRYFGSISNGKTLRHIRERRLKLLPFGPRIGPCDGTEFDHSKACRAWLYRCGTTIALQESAFFDGCLDWSTQPRPDGQRISARLPEPSLWSAASADACVSVEACSPILPALILPALILPPLILPALILPALILPPLSLLPSSPAWPRAT